MWQTNPPLADNVEPSDPRPTPGRHQCQIQPIPQAGNPLSGEKDPGTAQWGQPEVDRATNDHPIETARSEHHRLPQVETPQPAPALRSDADW